jgi:hypothetical protein
MCSLIRRQTSLITGVEVQCTSGHTNHSSTLANWVKKTDEQSCEAQSLLLDEHGASNNISFFQWISKFTDNQKVRYRYVYLYAYLCKNEFIPFKAVIRRLVLTQITCK